MIGSILFCQSKILVNKLFINPDKVLKYAYVYDIMDW